MAACAPAVRPSTDVHERLCHEYEDCAGGDEAAPLLYRDTTPRRTTGGASPGDMLGKMTALSSGLPASVGYRAVDMGGMARNILLESRRQREQQDALLQKADSQLAQAARQQQLEAVQTPRVGGVQAALKGPNAAQPGAGDGLLEDGVLTTELLSKGLLSTVPMQEDNGEASDLGRVAQEFRAQLPDASLYGVYRIEHPGLFVIYDAVRKAWGSPKELDLWHGTSAECARNIALGGFNSIYAGRHGTRLGHGTYFSRSADYSLRFCGRKGRARRVMLLAKVLVGAWTEGAPDLLEPPHRDANQLSRFDSTVDNIDSPSVFCVFRDFQAIPCYLVEFA